MAITRRREELVVFRLTDQELAALKRGCEAKGGRNLSEFARTELLISAHSIEIAALKDKIESVDRLLSGLEDKYNTLARELRSLGSVRSPRESLNRTSL